MDKSGMDIVKENFRQANFFFNKLLERERWSIASSTTLASESRVTLNPGGDR